MKRIFAITCFLLAAPAWFAAETPQKLTLQEARAIVLEKNPRITVAELAALVARQNVREARSAHLPNIWASLGAVGTAKDRTRIVSLAGLPTSSVFNRLSASIFVNQLVTDFGRTGNLVDSAQLGAKAQEFSAQATRAQLLLQLDAAYFNTLQARALLRVAQENASVRQSLRDQIAALATNQLKSTLDASFAEIGHQEAQLALVTAENDLHSAFATLTALLGSQESQSYELAEEQTPAAPEKDATRYIATALEGRPDLLQLRSERDSAMKMARAEKALLYPSLGIQGTAGVIPVHDEGVNDEYAAAGIILNIPLFSGNANSARQQAALLRAQSSQAALVELENNTVREVRLAWLAAGNTHARLAMTDKLVEQARQSWKLADAAYRAGSSSIVELGQAQLNLTSAESAQASSRYDYLLQLSVLAFQTGQLK